LAVPVIDARRGTVFTAVFRTGADGSAERLTEDAQLSADELMETLAAYGDAPIRFCGDAGEAMLLHPACPKTAVLPPVRLRMQSAVGAGIRAYALFTAPGAVRENFTEAALIPAYLKKSQAERERDERIAAAAGKN
jgi:tRNA A37 threonylcarbamoyladenosine modification protein TsaB